MAKQKLGRVLSRSHRRDYGKWKNPLPDNLIFLTGIPFYAVTKCQLPDSIKRQFRIEILPFNLKKIVESLTSLKNANEKLKQKLKKIRHEKRELQSEVDEAKQKMDELEGFSKQLQLNNQILMDNMGDDWEFPKSPFKSCLQIIDEKGIDLGIPPLQGGLPGLGKKK